MKKNWINRRGVPIHVLKKVFLMMKLTFLLTVVLQVSTWATGFSQENRVSLQMKDVSLETIILELREQTGIRFFYSIDKIKAIEHLSIDVKNEVLKDVLSRLLEGTGLTYTLLDDVIVIKDLVVNQDPVRIFIRLKGWVVDEKKRAMPGVTVKLSGTSLGTATDAKGWFSLQLPVPEGRLEFSFVGFATQIVDFSVRTARDTMRVVLKEDLIKMDEVVVTGYQAVKKKAMAGSYSKVDADELVMTGSQTLEQMLQGKLPGVMVINQSGLTGTRQKVRVRGTSTLVGNADPVWVVDGIIQQDPLPFSTSELTNIGDDNMDMIKNFVGGAIAWLNPNDIQDITVLKDASATAIYGVKAANGVIVITTKKGERGRLSLNYSGNFSVGEKLNYDKLEIMNSKQRVDLSREAYERGAQVPNDKIGYIGLALAYQRGEISYDEFDRGAKALESVNTNWFDVLYQTPFSHSHSLSFSGGNENSTYYASLGYSSNQNTAKGNSQTSYTGRLNLSSTFWNKLRLNVSLSGSHTETKAFANGVDPFNYAINANRAIACYEEDGSLFYYASGDDGYDYNILNELKYSGNENRSRSLNLSVDARWTILEGFVFSTTLGGGSISTFGESWFTERTHYIAGIRGYNYGEYDVFDTDFKVSPLPYGGELNVDENEGFNYSWRGQFEYIKNFGRHAVNVMVGGELSSNKHKSYAQTNYGYMPERGLSFVDVPLGTRPSTDANYTLNGYARTAPSLTKSLNNTLSYYVSGSYMYDNRYALNFSVRGDGSNRFGQDEKEKYLPVWSIGARWNVTDEHWLQGQDLLNYLSLSATFGYQGNVVENVSANLIAKILPLDPETGEFKMTYTKLPNPDLKWEKTKSINLGINFSVLHSKVNGSFEYYYKKTEDLVTQREIPYENGEHSMYVNGGNMKNSGWELSFSLVPVRTRDFVWSLGFNTSKVYNEVSSEFEPTGDWKEVTGGKYNKKGYPVSSFWAFRFAGLNPRNGGPLFDMSGAATNAGELDVTQYMVHAGKLDPDLTAGLNMNFRYKNWTLATSFYLSTGNQCFLSSPYGEMNNTYGMPSEYKNASTQLLKRWRESGDEKYTNIPSIPVGENCLPMYPFKDSSVSLYPYEAWANSDVRVVDAWYLRCNSISLSYVFPERLIRRFAQNVGFTMTLSNPFQIVSSDFDSRDPEVAKGSQPLTRNFTLSLNVSF